MWADAVVSGLAPITIHAEYLKSGREVVGDEPTVNLLSASAPQSNHLAPMFCTVVVDMVDCQERWFRFTATGALIPAICVVTLVLEPLIVPPVCFTVPVEVGETPFSHPLGGNAGVALFPPLLRCLHPIGVGKLPLAVFLSHPVLVSFPPRNPKVCLAGAAHGIDAVLGLVEPELSLGFLNPAFAACLHLASAWLLIVLVIIGLRPGYNRDVPAIHGI